MTNIDRDLVQHTESLLKIDSPPILPTMQWSGRCRWLVLLVVLCAGLGLWYQYWFFFSVGVIGQITLLVMSLQFRINVAHLLVSESHSPPDGLRIIDNLRLHWNKDIPTTFRAGQETELTLYVEVPDTSLICFALELRNSVYLSTNVPLPSGDILRWKPSSQHPLSVTLRMPVVGKYRIHGVDIGLQDRWGLFQVHRYVRVPLLIRVLPSIPLRRIDRQGNPLRLEMREQPGAPQKRVGAGTELRDIRDYRPGDARRNIVWKHSVRLQKLLCREFESETLISSYLLFDIGQSMRQGLPGHRPIDHATEVIAGFAKSALSARDAVGLISYDGTIYQHSQADVGDQQLHRILLHLEQVHQVTEPAFAHMRLSQLAAWVGNFLYREGLLSRQHGQLPPTNYQTVAYLWDLFWRHPSLSFPKHWDSDRQLVEKVLRYFCRVIGLELPYRYQEWVTQKSVGFQESLKQASQSLHAGQMIAVLSDLDDIIDWDGILRVIRLIRQRRQHLVFLCPFSPWFETQDTPTSHPNDDMLRDIFTLEMWRHRQRTERLAKKWGIPILPMEPEVAPLALLKRLQRIRWGGRV